MMRVVNINNFNFYRGFNVFKAICVGKFIDDVMQVEVCAFMTLCMSRKVQTLYDNLLVRIIK